MTALILAPIPQVRDWPFYGRAVECITGKWPARLHVDDLEQFENAVQHRRKIEEAIRDAKGVLGKLEADLAAIDETWPSWQRTTPPATPPRPSAPATPDTIQA